MPQISATPYDKGRQRTSAPKCSPSGPLSRVNMSRQATSSVITMMPNDQVTTFASQTTPGRAPW